MIGSLLIHEMALRKRARVAIGCDIASHTSPLLLNSLLFATKEKYVDPLLVVNRLPSSREDPEGVVGAVVPAIVDDSPWEALVSLLEEGVVDSAVRGNLSSRQVVTLLKKRFGCRNLCRSSLLEIDGRLVLLAPVGIDEGDTQEDLLTAVENCGRFAGKLGMELKVAVLSGGRIEDRGRSSKVDAMLSEADQLVSYLLSKGVIAVNLGVEIERAIDEGFTLILAPDGIFGNLIFRSLVLVGKVQSYGAYATALPKVFVDTSRSKTSYLLPLILASALS
ncbi:MAG: methanogenesis marker protein Mmp4/MtxX [Candidatus Verstraetearchaeota archaeon]|nr:methanogenesis marker protein Mmp4/MtxX [Candidatus Verstraetearchaeota archaeon]